MADNIERIFRIYNRLRRGPVTIEIIHNWATNAGIEVSKRQLYRDLNKLTTLHLPDGENVVEYADEKNRKIWKLEFDESVEKLSQYDISSFFLFKNFIPYSVYEQRKGSMAKFERIIYQQLSKNKYQQHIQANELYLRRTNFNDNMYGEIEHRQIEDLIWALHNKKLIVIEKELLNAANIHFPDDPFPLEMYPMELLFHRGRIHIAGVAKKNRQLLIFAIDKNLQFRLTNMAFDRGKFISMYNRKLATLFGISDPVDDRVYNVKIEFTGGYGESFKNFYWHHSQKWTRLKNGNYMLSMHCSIGWELVGFVAMGLDKVKVHEPKSLKILINSKAYIVAEIHAEDLPIYDKAPNKC